MTTARMDMADTAASRAKVYGLLAALFRAEPSPTLVAQLRAPEFSEMLASVDLSLGTAFHQAPAERLAEDLAVEYTKLFIGPGPHISPHESIFVEAEGAEGGLWGEKTVDVKKFIESAGFTYQRDFSGLPDHVAAELEFMQKLAETEADLLSRGEAERADWCLRVQRMFFEDHLAKWVPKLCEAVIEKAEMPFYAQIAKLTKRFLEFDRRLVVDGLTEVAG